MPQLPLSPTLRDLQSYVVELEKERDFGKQSAIEKCLLLGEEFGELFRAVRKQSQMSTAMGTPDNKDGVGGELTDVLIYLLCIANRFDVDMEAAFRAKEDINKMRTWQ